MAGPQRHPSAVPLRIVIAAAIVVLAACSGSPTIAPSTIGSSAAASAAASLAPSASLSPTAGQPIPAGTYLSGAQSIAAFKAGITADTTLADADKKSLLGDPLLSCTAPFISIEFRAGSLVESSGCDGEPLEVGARATYAFPDDHTLVMEESCCGTTTFAVTSVPDAFFLKRTSARSTGKDGFIEELLFESSPFMLKGATPRAIPDGTYAGPDIKIPDLIKLINADSKASAAEKTHLIDTAFGLPGHSTYGTTIELADGHFAQSDRLDGKTSIGARGTYAFPDASTIVWQELTLNRFQVAWADASFTMKLLGKPNYASAEDALAAQIFWASPFSLVP
jgi:hypothetical protein